ncbi:MAG: RES family NAD+ phosphorylase [Mycobacteriales bacterium]
MSTDSLAARLALVPAASEAGIWQRHARARTARHGLDGRAGDGRWGTRGAFPVLYLGRPTDSVVVEAYRHLVDPVDVEDAAERDSLLDNLVPRVLITCSVSATGLLDLRSPGARGHAGLTLQDLQSGTDDQDAYRRCQEVAQVAHQLGRHGVIAPAATGLGETLALFTDLLPSGERPVRSAEDEPWVRLPADPRTERVRQLRVVPRTD